MRPHSNYNEGKSYSKDNELWESFKQGNKDSFARIYDLHSDSLYKYGMHLCKDSNLVEDVIHDLFVYIWENRGNLSNVKSIRLYLKTSLRREIFNKLRKNRFVNDEELLNKGVFEFSLQTIERQNQDNYKKDIEQNLINSLNKLSPRQKEIIYLRFYQNMSYDQIANHLSLETGYTYNVASKAYAKIKLILKSCSVIVLLFFIFLFF